MDLVGCGSFLRSYYQYFECSGIGVEHSLLNPVQCSLLLVLVRQSIRYIVPATLRNVTLASNCADPFLFLEYSMPMVRGCYRGVVDVFTIVKIVAFLFAIRIAHACPRLFHFGLGL